MAEKESAMDHDAERGHGIPHVSPTWSSSTEHIRNKEVHVGASRTPSSAQSLEAAHSDHQRNITSSPAPIPASIANSLRPAPVKVPRSKRRGLFGRFSIIAEVEEPKDYPNKTKWFLTFVIAVAAAAAPFGSTIFFPSLLQVSEDLHTTPTITNLSVALYMLSMSIFPLWWSSFSETLGRRTIYLTSFSLFLLWNILSALSNSIAMLIVMRVLGGGAAASVQAVGAGTIADIWAVRERGQAMGIFYLGPLMGPLFAPIIGGALAEKWGWRSTQWFLAIYGGIILVFLFFALPETLKVRKSIVASAGNGHSVTPNQRPSLSRASSTPSVHQKTKKWVKAAKLAFIDPLKIILNLRYPAVLLTVWLASITFGCLYVLNISLQSTFSKPPYSFSTLIVGLTYIPNSIGYILASLLGGRWTDKIMAREAIKAGRYDEKGKLVYRPEDRLRENAWIAIFLYPGALVWYGWTAEQKVFWLVPLLANFFFGVGSMLIFSASTTMLTEFMPNRASAGVATNNFVRNIFSCVGGIVAQPLLDAIGNGWLFTGLGVIAAASSVAIWAMRRFGPRWRTKMEAQLNS
ncbi:MAG: MFS multidrug resistance transporter [Lasallia pustulata]|uniref:MFS multidrug resistance transporter n=1 Tax=Lasallia pustulata TaxID=136370 RepID=A0A5M8PYA3_9LECA|nr:MAG: MFS multidrug resistance transporter [Lasallia pustulata]